ncbi:hypothetical protein BDF22DRAFT_620435 [Syncephalis plumigaleata]|nr:hypothetical protein BDF22DRAFT_620435 [Syncephalis plumigaleata]
MTFNLLEEFTYHSPAINYPASVYTHSKTGLRVVLLNIPGPLCYLTIVVPTGNESEEGLPHTLEHLIFCGSKETPQRGYLDTLACRSLSSGTNAYTTEEFTAYTLDTAGVDGMRNVLPIYLQHVLSPTLRDDQFITEVFHWDGQAKRQGVVFSEMAARENTSDDLMDRHLRQLLYSDNATYFHECGGLTQHIMQLDNEKIKQYHRRYYQPRQMTLVLTGQSLNESLLGEIDNVLDVFEQASTDSINVPPVFCADYRSLPKGITSRAIKFASAEEDVGDIAYGWQGPLLSDVKTCIALQILFRYFEDTAASPLRQRFVELEHPWASFIWSNLQCYARPYFSIVFSGVPYESDSESANDSNDNTTPANLLTHGTFYRTFMQELQNVVKNGFFGKQNIRDTIERHRRVLCEELEHNPHEVVMDTIIQDVVAQTFLAGADTTDIPKIGSQSNVFQIIDSLLHEDDNYWKALMTDWLIDAPMVEVIMIPDGAMAEELEHASLEQERKKKAELGEEGLALLGEIAKRAIAANKVNVPPELIATMPALPPIDNVPQLESKFLLEQVDNSSYPFAATQLVTADTLFTHLQIGLPIAALPQHLRPWLVLFQSVLYELPVVMHSVMSSLDVSVSQDNMLDYREVATGMARDLVSHTASIGYGNQLLGVMRLSDYIIISGTCEHRNYGKMLSWLLGGLVGMKYDMERISTITRNLLSDISEMQRKGSDMVEAVLARVTAKKQLDAVAKRQPNQCHLVATNQNDCYVNLFRQRAFLKGVLARLKTTQGQGEIIKALDDIKNYLLSNRHHDITEGGQCELGGFLQIAAPSEIDHASLHRQLLTAWNSVAYRTTTTKASVQIDAARGPFPAPRSPYDISTDVQLIAPGDLLVMPLPALSASYLSCVLPCDVLAPINDPEHPAHREKSAISILCELLSRVDGPIYEAVRGKGYAYGAGVNLYSWHGQLVYSVSEAQDPARALDEFWRILKKLDTHWDSVCDEHALEAARAIVAYHWFSRRATSNGVIGSAVDDAFRVSIM